MCSTSTPKTYDDPLQEYELLCHRLEEAGETIDALPQGVAILDRRGRVLSCNVSFADLVEKPQRSLIGANVSDFLKDENSSRWLKLLQGAASGEARGECSFRRGAGGVFPAAVILSALPTKSIRLELVDLTATRGCESILEAKKQLETSEERLRLAVEATGIGVVDTHFPSSGGGKVVEWTREARAAFGLADDLALSDEVIFDRIFPADRDLVRHAIARSLDPGGNGLFKVEHRVVRPDGEIRWISSRGQTTFGGEPPRPVRNVATVMDVTEQVSAAEALRAEDVSLSTRAEDALREMNQRKDEFLATLAHELRNPLAPILTCLQLLRMEDDDAQSRRQSYDVIERQTRQLTRLVNDLMDVVRISRGKIKLQKSLVDLAGVVDTAIESSQPLITDRGHRLDLICPPNPIPVEADPERLAQVIANLLINAAKFTDPGGRISLSAAVEENQAVVRVKDSGVGIAPEMLARVFDPFMQVDRTPQRSQTGLGLGLSLVRGLTEMHGGTVHVHSDGPGKGSEFLVRLPLFSNQPAQERSVNLDEKADYASLISSRKIMVVDDNRDLADSFAKLLRLMGHEVRTTHDGRQVLEAARIFRPELIFLDIGLPGMDGYAVAEAVRDDPTLRSTLLVALTGYGAATDRQRTQEAGFSAHLVKPVRFADVHDLLDRLLGSETPRAS